MVAPQAGGSGSRAGGSGSSEDVDRSGRRKPRVLLMGPRRSVELSLEPYCRSEAVLETSIHFPLANISAHHLLLRAEAVLMTRLLTLQWWKVEYSQSRVRRNGSERYLVYRENEEILFGRSQVRSLSLFSLALSSQADLVGTCSSFLSMRMWDLPGGQLDPEQLNLSFEDTDAVIFVIDAQSSMGDTIRKLSVTMHKAYVANPGIQFEVFLHKVDGMSEDFRLGASNPPLFRERLLQRVSTDS